PPVAWSQQPSSNAAVSLSNRSLRPATRWRKGTPIHEPRPCALPHHHRRRNGGGLARGHAHAANATVRSTPPAGPYGRADHRRIAAALPCRAPPRHVAGSRGNPGGEPHGSCRVIVVVAPVMSLIF